MQRVLIPQHLETLPQALPVGEQFTLSGQTMGTTWTVRYIHSQQDSQAAVRALIQDELDLVVRQMSTWQQDSNISLFNQAEADTWHPLPDPFFTVIDCALKIAADTNGAFDPTIGQLVNLWGFGPQGERSAPPKPDEICRLKASCGWQRLQLDTYGRQLRQPGNAYIDFSGIAKGYGVDRVSQALQRAGIDNYLIEVGGELYGAGIKPDGQPWWVALELPPGIASAGNESIAALCGVAVATSGDYRRYFEYDNQHYAHTIDPRTGYPIDRSVNALASVTVIHAQCMKADALATAFTVMGRQAALDYAQKNHIATLLIEQTSDGFKEHLSPELTAMLE
ncbi:MAG TPA: FAD:protein FMN transferase [Methylophilus sp.]|uniref:FAD:protein FMN transferase n=1 Tax=Methylophilus sp. TaxID=29541 RepID=UPI002BF25923|nr:FAD:protein FMN transferase [Methylophilus sp.]HSH87710.1 FAD:protein FMN transferase [Methylophilus sp.]